MSNLTNDIKRKESERNELQKAIDAYLASGKEIDKHESNVRNEPKLRLGYGPQHFGGEK